MNNLILSTWSKLSSIRKYVCKEWFTFVLYHRIKPESFKKHLEYYKNHYRISELELLRAFYEDKASLPRNPLFITFDDGWKSSYDLLPIIEDMNIPITVFLTTGLIGTNKKSIPISNYSKDKTLIIDDTSPTESYRTMLSLEEIKEMRKLVNFQSHGVNHHLSTKITSYQLESELIESRKIIEKITGKPVYAFAYPYNRASEKEAKIVESCGYTLARRGGRMMNKLGTYQFLINSIGIEEHCSLKNLQNKMLRAEIKTMLQ